MKKHVYVFLIFLISLGFILFNIERPELFKVVEIKAPDKLCIDFNYNSKCDLNEIVKPYGIEVFPEKFGSQTNFIEQRYSIEEKNSVVLGVMAKEYLKENYLNKYVKIEILNQNSNNSIIGKIYAENVDLAQTLLKNGWAFAPNSDEYKIYENFSAIKNNIKKSKNYNYQLRNKKNGKIHTLDCKYGRNVKDYEIGIFDDEKYKIDYSKDCHQELSQPKTKISAQNFDFKSNSINVYFLDFTHTLRPDTTCSSLACKNLLDNINNSKESIDFAIYGLGNIPKIENALKSASKRGVKIRYVVDEDANHENIYDRTDNLKEALPDYKTDYFEGESKKFNDFIMHNKFFIFDKGTVWLGSANISETDLSGFSANNVIVIKSKELAKIYEKEFEKMFNGNFHTHKKSTPSNEIFVDSTPIKAGFSPEENVITNYIIPIVNNAEKSILIETFIFTHKGLSESLIQAKKRGVDVKIIVDATSASSSYSLVKKLRQNGIQVKVENYAGKMHMKTLIIDDEYFISGSMNLTKSGEKYNDENMLIIKNKDIVKQATGFFNYIWKQIPDKYLTKNPRPESKESIGSCEDGIDNNYDGKSDKGDNSCK